MARGIFRGWPGLAAGLILLLALTAPAAGRVPLASRLGALGLREMPRSPDSTHAVFSNRWNCIEVAVNSRRIDHNGVSIYLNGPVLREGSALTVSEIDWREGIGFPWIALPANVRRKQDLVLLDAGHGGLDKGAISKRQLEESRVNMDVARRVGRILEANGVAVRYTRSADKAVSLDERIASVRKIRPDAFVSLHVNATANPAIRGVETYVMTASGYSSTSGGKEDRESYDGNRNGVSNMRLAHAVQANLLDHTGAADRGVKRARYAVIKGAPVPGILVEMGFLTNSSEEGLLISRAYRDRIATGVARGILSYLTTARKPPPARQEG